MPVLSSVSPTFNIYAMTNLKESTQLTNGFEFLGNKTEGGVLHRLYHGILKPDCDPCSQRKKGREQHHGNSFSLCLSLSLSISLFLSLFLAFILINPPPPLLPSPSFLLSPFQSIPCPEKRGFDTSYLESECPTRGDKSFFFEVIYLIALCR